MKVLLVGNYLPDRQYSMLTFASCLERELPKLGCTVTRIAPTSKLGAYGSRGVRKWLAYIDKFATFPRTLRRQAANHDVVHILDHGNAMYVPHVETRPHLVTCHDLLAVRASLGEIPGWVMRSTGKKYQALILSGLKQSSMIAAVSLATRDDLLRLTRLPQSRVRLRYNGLYQPLSEVSLDEATRELGASGIQRPFFLHVGGDDPYKNRLGLLEIYSNVYRRLGKDCPDLVLAGRPPSSETAVRITTLQADKVRVVESPTAQMLTALYQRAVALLFPSLYEGFGLPILEAQVLGCPVFTSDRGPMNEVGGEAAVYFDPLDPLSAANKICDHIDDVSSMRDKGRQNALRFSTSEMVEGYFGLYSELVGGRSN